MSRGVVHISTGEIERADEGSTTCGSLTGLEKGRGREVSECDVGTLDAVHEGGIDGEVEADGAVERGVHVLLLVGGGFELELVARGVWADWGLGGVGTL